MGESLSATPADPYPGRLSAHPAAPCHHGFVITRLLSVLGAALLGLATAGCAGGTPAPPPPLAGTEPPPTPSPSPRALSAGEQLAARAVLPIDFAARYTLTNGAVASVLTLSHLAGGQRIDIEDGASLTTLLSTAAGTVACDGRAPAVTCRTVAAAGAPVPAELDVRMQRVLLQDLAQLADTAAYDVVDAVAPSPTASTPQMSCWQVTPRTGAPEPVARAGVYCFGRDGVPTAITYPESSLALSERLPLPDPSVLVPPATPRPLP